jgi:hypothetical protein
MFVQASRNDPFGIHTNKLSNGLTSVCKKITFCVYLSLNLSTGASGALADNEALPWRPRPMARQKFLLLGTSVRLGEMETQRNSPDDCDYHRVHSKRLSFADFHVLDNTPKRHTRRVVNRQCGATRVHSL